MTAPTRSMTVHAADQKRGLTLAEVGRFVQESMRQDIDPETPLAAILGWGGQLRSLTVDERKRSA